MSAKVKGPEEFDLGDGEDAADLGRAIAAADGDSTSASAGAPKEAGPRRYVVTTVGAAALAGVLWMLFRSVPPEDPSGAERQGSPDAAAVEATRAATQSDPQWMQNADTARRFAGAPGGVVPPIAFGSRAPEGAVYGDTAPRATPDGAAQPQQGAAGANGDAVPPPELEKDERRQAFARALGSKPLSQSVGLGSAAGSAAAESGGSGIAPGLTYAEAEAAAQAEAQRRAAPGGAAAAARGGVEDAVLPPGVPGYGDASAGRASRSSYVVGAANAPPRAMSGEVLIPRGGTSVAGAVTLPVATVIRGQLHTAINSDLPGSAVGVVTHDVYDASMRFIAIPRFSWLFGTYESDVASGQARLVLQWTALRLPSGETYDLPGLRAGDPTGASGVRGRVDNHYRAVFGQAVLSSIIAAGFELGRGEEATDGERSRRDRVADVTSQQLGQVAADVTRRNLNIKPTITVARLTAFSVILDRDLTLVVPPRR